jgi:hypothetical protein
MKWTADDQKKAIEAFTRRASTDKKFRELALKDPAKAIKELVGKDLPDGLKLRAVARDGADLVVVVPDMVKPGGELSDSELEQVSGGRCGGSCGGSCACAAMTM